MTRAILPMFCALLVTAVARRAEAQGCDVKFLDSTGTAPDAGATFISDFMDPSWTDAAVSVLQSPMCVPYYLDGATPALIKTTDTGGNSLVVRIYSKRHGNNLYLGFHIPDTTEPLAAHAFGDQIHILIDPLAKRGTSLSADYYKIVHRTSRGVVPTTSSAFNSSTWYKTDALGAWGALATPAGFNVATDTGASATGADFFRVVMKIPLSAFTGYNTGTYPDMGIAIAFVNDIGYYGQLTPGGPTVSALTGVSFPDRTELALVTAPTSPATTDLLPANWSNPSYWGNAVLLIPVPPVPGTFSFLKTPISWRATDDLRAAFCTATSFVDAGDASTTNPKWYVYYQDPADSTRLPCGMRAWVKVQRSGGTGTFKKRLVVLWAEDGAGQANWHFVHLTAPIDFTLGTGEVISPQIDWPDTAIPRNMNTHPCMRAYILPETLAAPYDQAGLQAITTQTQINAMMTQYGLTNSQMTQININLVKGPFTCPPCPQYLADPQDHRRPQGGKRPEPKPHPLDVIVDLTALAVGPGAAGSPYRFVGLVGGERHIVNLEHLKDVKQVKLDLKLTNDAKVPRAMIVQGEIVGESRRDVSLTYAQPVGEFAAGEKRTIVAVLKYTGASAGPSVSLHGGVAIPHGRLRRTHTSGAAATIDFELPLTRSLSVEAMAGVGRFNGKSGIPDVDIFTYVVDAKLYLVDGDWRPFVMGGGGVSSSNPGMAGGEWNVGAGLRYDASARFAFEAGYQFHETYQGGKGVPFSTLQVGVLLKF